MKHKLVGAISGAAIAVSLIATQPVVSQQTDSIEAIVADHEDRIRALEDVHPTTTTAPTVTTTTSTTTTAPAPTTTAPAGQPALLTSTLTPGPNRLDWAANGTFIDDWDLVISTTEHGDDDVYDDDQGLDATATTTTVEIPNQTVYIRLFWTPDNWDTYDFADYTITPTGASSTTSTETTVDVKISITATPTTVTTPTPSAEAWDYVGQPFTPHFLGNLPVRSGWRYSYRFTAKESGAMSGFQNFWATETSRNGYAAGNGGLIQVTLHPDNGNGLPNEAVTLAQTTPWQPGLINGAGPGQDQDSFNVHPINYKDQFWPTQPTLIAGQKYHLKIENIHASSGSNYLSLNNGYSTRGELRGPYGPQVADWGMTVDWGDGAGWGETTSGEKTNTEPNRYEITMMILMANGKHYGNSLASPVVLNVSAPVAQGFTVPETVTVDSLSVLANGSGTLTATLKANGTQVGQWTSNAGGSWRHHIFPTGQRILTAGVNYQLEITGNYTLGTFRDGGAPGSLGYTFPTGGSFIGHATQNGDDISFTYNDLVGVAFRKA